MDNNPITPIVTQIVTSELRQLFCHDSFAFGQGYTRLLDLLQLVLGHGENRLSLRLRIGKGIFRSQLRPVRGTIKMPLPIFR